MRFCKSCSHWKPDANFSVATTRQGRNGRRFAKRCSQCRAGNGIGMRTFHRTGPEKIEVSERDLELILTAREERSKFIERGNRRILRPYTRISVNGNETIPERR